MHICVFTDTIEMRQTISQEIQSYMNQLRGICHLYSVVTGETILEIKEQDFIHAHYYKTAIY